MTPAPAHIENDQQTYWKSEYWNYNIKPKDNKLWKKIEFSNCLSKWFKNASYGKTDNPIRFYEKNHVKN